MKVLVSGATGFIGDYIVRDLLRRKVSVIATSPNLSKAREKEWFSQVEYKNYDLKNFEASQDLFQYFLKPDTMIHLAWEGLPNYKNDFHVNENLPRHFLFLQNLLRSGLKDLSVTGTCFEYGLQEGELREVMPTKPNNAYALAKDRLRKKLESLQPSFDFSLKWLRLFYMYGKGQNTNSLIAQLESSLDNQANSFDMSGGEQTRDFLSVNCVAEYIVSVALQKKINGIINICSGNPISVKDFVEHYLEKKGKKIKLNLGVYPYSEIEPMHFWGNTDKLKKITSQLNDKTPKDC